MILVDYASLYIESPEFKVYNIERARGLQREKKEGRTILGLASRTKI